MDTSQSSSWSAQRRTFRFGEPRQQARLALVTLATTVLFGLLAFGNSYAAYKDLIDVAVTTSPTPIGEDLREQTRQFMKVTSALAAGYALAVLAISMIFVQRIVGPLVAVERHVRALKAGNYSSRIELRGGASIFSDLALQLNDLAMKLHREASESELRASRRPWAA